MGSMQSILPQNALVKAAVYDVGIQWVLWFIASLLQTEKFYDLAGSSTFLFLTWQTLLWNKRFFPRQVIQSGCVSMWALRLGLFLFTRVLREQGDSRFKNVRGNPARFFLYWTVQAVWIWVTLLPTMILNSTERDQKLNWKDYLGWAIWGAGFLIEATADYQKSQFKSDPANKGKWIASGLWSLCRYPNYLGEIMLWSGLFLPAASVMSGMQFCSVISPMFVTFLLTRVSGIPLQERQAIKRWGGLAAYQQHRQNTALLIPYIW